MSLPGVHWRTEEDKMIKSYLSVSARPDSAESVKDRLEALREVMLTSIRLSALFWISSFLSEEIDGKQITNKVVL